MSTTHVLKCPGCGRGGTSSGAVLPPRACSSCARYMTLVGRVCDSQAACGEQLNKVLRPCVVSAGRGVLLNKVDVLRQCAVGRGVLLNLGGTEARPPCAAPSARDAARLAYVDAVILLEAMRLSADVLPPEELEPMRARARADVKLRSAELSKLW